MIYLIIIYISFILLLTFTRSLNNCSVTHHVRLVFHKTSIKFRYCLFVLSNQYLIKNNQGNQLPGPVALPWSSESSGVVWSGPPMCIIAKAVKSCILCCSVRCAALIVWVGGIPGPKDHAINGLVFYNSWDVSAFWPAEMVWP